MTRRSVALALAGAIAVASNAHADGLVDIRVDFDGDLGMPEFTDLDASNGTDAAAALVNELYDYPQSEPVEGRQAYVLGGAQPNSLRLDCTCSMSETPQGRCESTITRDDFFVTGPPRPSVVVTYSMRVRADLDWVGGLVPGNLLLGSLAFRIDPPGPGSRVQFSGSQTDQGIVVDEPVEVNQVDVIAATETHWEAVVRRSRSVALDTPFDFEAELLAICGASNSVFIDGAMLLQATATQFQVTTNPPGYLVVAEPAPSALAVVAAIALAAPYRRSQRRTRGP